MNIPAFPIVDRAELNRALERGAVALTPNRRLARALKHAFDGDRLAQGCVVWPRAEVLPWDAWLERNYAQVSHRAGRALLTPLQEQTLWEATVSTSSAARGLVQPAAAASLAHDAWKLAHDWHLFAAVDVEPLSEDGCAFREWSSGYAERLRELRAIDTAQLSRHIVEGLCRGDIASPTEVVLCGFRESTPAMQEIVRALVDRGTRISELAAPETRAQARCIALSSTQDEIRAAACWARARLEANSAARIGVVVHDLAQVREQVLRVFRDILQPDAVLPGMSGTTFPFNVSLGVPLGAYPIARAAVAAMELARGRTKTLTWSVLLRSPYLGSAERERDGRSRLDARLRQLDEIELDLGAVRYYAQAETHAPDLAARIDRLREMIDGRMTDRKTPSRWVEVLLGILAVLGFPGERALASDEFQTWRRLKEALASLASLDGIAPAWDLDRALARAHQLLREAIFQPETPEVPIQVVGILEAAALEFDHLWIAGLTDEVWPAAPRPNPFLPVALQRRAGVPHASAEQELQFATSLTEGFLRAAPEVVLSHALREEDRNVAPSPLIARLPAATQEELGVARYPTLARTVATASRNKQKLQYIDDTCTRTLPPGGQRYGGTFVFRDEAACPFRAYANHRVGAGSLCVPQPGLDAKARGSLMHDVLAEVWRELKTRDALAALDDDACTRLVERKVADALDRLRKRRRSSLSGRFASIERQRLIALVSEWLRYELAREDFDVEFVEHKRPVTFGGLAVNAKLDRVDRLPDGRRIVIDYKTGDVKISSCVGPRLDEPQLPIYCVSSSDPVVAVAFAVLRVDNMVFRGLARDAGLLPKVRAFMDTKEAAPYGNWSALTVAWQEELDRLGQAFVRGDADVLPKRYPNTCEFCDVGPFCRVSERVLAGSLSDDGDDVGE